MAPLQIIRINNTPRSAAWLFVAAGVGLWIASPYLAEQRLPLQLCGLIAALAGAAVLVWNFKQVVTVQPALRCILVDISSRFGNRQRRIPFNQIGEIVLNEYRDSDPDARLTKVAYQVIARLRDGNTLALTDQSFDQAEMERLRGQLRAMLDH